MSSSPSRISVTVDFDQPGRQFGLYKIPWSDNSQPSGHIGPMAVLANGEGPTLLLTGGVHGDEYAGPVAIMRLAHELDLVRLQGRLILLPSLNTPAVQAALRCSPLDDGNLNRAFPGDPNGGPTAMIAHWLETQVLPLCDGAIDFHSGGTSSDYEPIVMVNRSPGELFARNMQLVRAFGVELVWLMGALNDNRSVNAASERAGVPMFACELGGKGESDPQMTQIAYDGALGVMQVMGMLSDRAANGQVPLRLVEVTRSECTVTAPHGGLFDPLVSNGTEITAGQLAGWIRDPFEMSRAPTAVHFQLEGHVAIRGSRGLVKAGEKLYGLVTDCPEGTVTP